MRTPGDEEQLNNANEGAGSVADEHERTIALRVQQAKAEEDARATQTNQTKSQKGKAREHQIGEVVISTPRVVNQSKYGRELPYPHGTLLIQKKNENLRPVEGAEEPTHVCGRVLDKEGWLVQRAIPMDEARKAVEVAS